MNVILRSKDIYGEFNKNKAKHQHDFVKSKIYFIVNVQNSHFNA